MGDIKMFELITNLFRKDTKVIDGKEVVGKSWSSVLQKIEYFNQIHGGTQVRAPYQQVPLVYIAIQKI